MTAVKRFRSAVILHRPSPTVRYGALGPPVGGTFHFENLLMPPLPNTCPKMVLSDKGGSLCVKDAFAKKFFGVGRDSAAGALASVRRTSSNSARPTVGYKLRVVAPCTGSDCTPQGVIVMRAVRSAMLAAAVILATVEAVRLSDHCG